MKCEICDNENIKVTVGEHQPTGVVTLNYCSPTHAMADMMKRYSRIMKASMSTNSSRLYITAVTVFGKLAKAVEKEWKATKKTA
jgi:hypothetical protein